MTARAFGDLAANLLGPRPKVRRSSYDINDPRADVFRPIGGGTVKGGLQWVDAFMQAVEEWNVQYRVPGKGVPLNGSCLRVLRAFLRKLDFKTGQLDPALTSIAQFAGCSKDTVVRSLKKLQQHGIIDWVRRSMATGAAKGEGPKREQVTNAYFFDPTKMPKRLAARLRQLVTRKRRKARPDRMRSPQAAERADLEQRAQEAPIGSPLYQMRSRLDRIGRVFGSSASLTSGQFTPSKHKGDKE
ncbi:helix-turn-helix domain-containing protein [Altericroceibacterium endophyticum]|uniref:Helix-turn-helix domain-containing protein n=1 Tax=Altericroceibacterium endophyticum TaxID=1808508 RepID=A0A6I4T1S6_9SPHN|nr:helix-turn-helix domain-containing protein [Altericroceibacterium endophyticum]MXO64828.1 hypothetical protein [Altericroceibacterium endophyticum]